MAIMLTQSGTMNINQSRRVVEMSDTIYLLEPNAAPLYVLVSKLKKKAVSNPKYEWMEDDLNPKYTTFAASATSTAVSATAGASYINEYDIIKNTDTDELMLVTNANGVTIKMTRAWGTSTAAAITANDTLHILGSAYEEGALLSAVNVLSTRVSNLYNQTQIFRKKVSITGTLEASDLYGGNDRQYQRKKKGIELMRDFETSFWWGARAETQLGTGHYTRTMAGVDYYVSTNATAAGGTLTETEFETALRGPFRYGNNQKYFFASPLIVSVISQWAQGKLEMVPKDKTYGIAISQYVSPHGTLNIVKENLFETDTSGVAFIIELGELQYVYLNGRDVKLETNLGTDGDDISVDQYICEIGMEIHSEKKHGKITGVTG